MGLRQRGSVAATAEADSTMWGLMYQAMMDTLGVEPSNFQLIFPFTSWNWPSASPGHTSSAEYDFLSTVPQWSGVGEYLSSGEPLSRAYENFLNALVVSADPIQQQKINDQQVVVQDIFNRIDQKIKDAKDAYAKDPTVVDNNPPFTSWLADPFGGGLYGKQLEKMRAEYEKALDFLQELIDQSTDPSFKLSMSRLNNQDYWTLVDTPSAPASFSAPGYSKTMSYMEWVTKVKGSGGGLRAQFSWNNSQSHFDWSKTWAGGDVSYGSIFWSVYASGSWEDQEWMATSSDLDVVISMEAMDQIQVQSLGWFDQTFLNARAQGEYRQGWGYDNFFGEKGTMGTMKTNMYVCYKPSFMITSGTAFSTEHIKKFKAAGGLRIGPFQFGASGGHESVIYNSEVTEKSFSGGSDSEIPFIFGITIQELGKS